MKNGLTVKKNDGQTSKSAESASLETKPLANESAESAFSFVKDTAAKTRIIKAVSVKTCGFFHFADYPPGRSI